MTREELGGPSGTQWWFFWCALAAPIVVSMAVELVFGAGWDSRAGWSVAIGLVLLMLACSGFCSVWIAYHFLENSTLRVFITSGLVLAFLCVYLVFVVALHYVNLWSDQV